MGESEKQDTDSEEFDSMLDKVFDYKKHPPRCVMVQRDGEWVSLFRDSKGNYVRKDSE